MAIKITFQKTVNGKVYLMYPYHPYEAMEYGHHIIGPGASKTEAKKDQASLKKRGFLSRVFIGENGRYYLYMANKK